MDENDAASRVVARDDISFRGAGRKVCKEIADPLIIEALALCDAFGSVQQGLSKWSLKWIVLSFYSTGTTWLMIVR